MKSQVLFFMLICMVQATLVHAKKPDVLDVIHIVEGETREGLIIRYGKNSIRYWPVNEEGHVMSGYEHTETVQWKDIKQIEKKKQNYSSNRLAATSSSFTKAAAPEGQSSEYRNSASNLKTVNLHIDNGVTGLGNNLPIGGGAGIALNPKFAILGSYYVSTTENEFSDMSMSVMRVALQFSRSQFSEENSWHSGLGYLRIDGSSDLNTDSDEDCDYSTTISGPYAYGGYGWYGVSGLFANLEAGGMYVGVAEARSTCNSEKYRGDYSLMPYLNFKLGWAF